MTIVITGATGQLGRLVIESLLERGIPASDLRALGRNADRLASFAAQGIDTRVIDFAQPETLDAAFSGADALLLVSGSEVGQRLQQHRNAIDAAVRAGVGRVVYTSASKATDTDLVVAPEHAETERLLAASGLPVTVLRNNWYTENYLGTLDTAAATGEIVASAGEGRVASATRADYAEAAAVVLTTPGHEGAVYELSGDTAWTFADLAEVASELLGREVVYRSVTPEEHGSILTGVGLDAGTAGFVVALDGNIRDGALAEATPTLRELIGRPTTPLADGLAQARAAA
ncbi:MULTISPECIES: SDR family oxidoreductase [unclassified Leifsonia]|uniref:SDR family oxidoreductase n=1 Tax=unclassified Leifsonia TaxID=2663824 RepID=UPI0008A7246D|nr:MULTISPECIES: SDR family oxidoreductase [unclassified Leifsonia]SEH91444.1 NAD(P)H dehydrogenase (quinone) [Leifsonia sp. CL154]SFL52388.1 NAD(P)H dehydrogenase (quinone) [Leifsonia sp. CL147]